MALWKNTRIGLLAFTVLGILVGCSLENSNQKLVDTNETKKESFNETEVFNLSDKSFYGGKDAPNTVVVFGDYECGACQSFHEKTMEDIKVNYIDSGQVKVYLYDLAFISEVSLVKALLAADIEKKYPEHYTEFVDEMYLLSGSESSQFTNKDFVSKKLDDLFPELDTEQLVNRVFIEDKSLMTTIEQNKTLANELGVNSTPAVFVNGIRMNNPFDVEEFKGMLQKKE